VGEGSVGARVQSAQGERKIVEKKEKRRENNKAPVGAYILGKNCRGRKRMRGNRRGKGQDDGNLPADILCVSCASEAPYRHPTRYTHHPLSGFRFSSRPTIPFISLLGLASIDYRC